MQKKSQWGWLLKSKTLPHHFFAVTSWVSWVLSVRTDRLEFFRATDFFSAQSHWGKWWINNTCSRCSSWLNQFRGVLNRGHHQQTHKQQPSQWRTARRPERKVQVQESGLAKHQTHSSKPTDSKNRKRSSQETGTGAGRGTITTCVVIFLMANQLTRAKILLRFFYLIGTRKLEVIETITWSAPETCG